MAGETAAGDRGGAFSRETIEGAEQKAGNVNERTYSFRLSREFRILIPAFLLFWTWIGLNRIAAAKQPLGALVLIFCLWGWFRYLTLAYHVEVRPEGSLLARTILGTSELDVRNITSIRETSLFYECEHSRGKLRIATLTDRVGGLRTVLTELNPNIQTS